jgi:hypothetical protein
LGPVVWPNPADRLGLVLRGPMSFRSAGWLRPVVWR